MAGDATHDEAPAGSVTVAGAASTVREPPPWRPTWRLHAVCLTVVLLVLAAVAVGVVVPYLVNGLQHLPLAEVASGAHDPKDLWPSTAGYAGALLRVLGLWSLVAGVPVILVTVLVSANALWQQRLDGSLTTRSLACSAATVAASAVFAVALLSPVGQALWTWALD